MQSTIDQSSATRWRSLLAGETAEARVVERFRSPVRQTGHQNLGDVGSSSVCGRPPEQKKSGA